MKIRALSLALLVLATTNGSSQAQIVITRSGVYLVSQDANGFPVFTDLKIKPDVKIIDLRDSTSPPITPPTPTPTPNPTVPVEAHRTKVKTATDKITLTLDPNRANSKKALAELYRVMSELPFPNTKEMSETTTKLFGKLPLPDPWKTWKVEVDKSLESFAALDDAKKAWQIVAEVLSQ